MWSALTWSIDAGKTSTSEQIKKEAVKTSFFYGFKTSASEAREERLELPTPGFGDRCSTN